MKISIQTKTSLNEYGQLGAWLLIGGTLATIVLYAFLVTAETQEGAFMLWSLTVVAGLTPLGGIVLLLVGRDYAHDVTVDPKAKQSDEVKASPAPAERKTPQHARNRGFA